MEKTYLKNIPLNSLIPYLKNPRINDLTVQQVIKSIQKDGYIDPIEVDEKNIILSGHARLKALKALGYSEVPDVIQVTGLSETQKKDYRIRANKTSDFSEFDYKLLFEELDQNEDLIKDMGFEYEKFEDDFQKKDNSNCQYPITPKFTEKHDFVLVYVDNEIDWAFLETVLNIQSKRDIKKQSTSKCKVITFEEFKKAWDSR